MGKRELVDFLLLPLCFLESVSVLWIFLTVPGVGLQCVTLVFPYHTYLLFVSRVVRG